MKKRKSTFKTRCFGYWEWLPNRPCWCLQNDSSTLSQKKWSFQGTWFKRLNRFEQLSPFQKCADWWKEGFTRWAKRPIQLPLPRVNQWRWAKRLLELSARFIKENSSGKVFNLAWIPLLPLPWKEEVWKRLHRRRPQKLRALVHDLMIWLNNKISPPNVEALVNYN